MTGIRVLLIEDNPGDTRLIREMLREADPTVQVAQVERLAQGLASLAEGATEVVLLDLSLPDSRGFGTFERTHASAPNVPIVVLSGLDDEETAVRAWLETRVIDPGVWGFAALPVIRQAFKLYSLP